MSKEEQKVIRQMKQDLRSLQQALCHSFQSDIKSGAFQKIINDLNKNQKLNYSSTPLEIKFNTENIPKHFPQKIIKNLKILFSIKVKGNVDDLLANKDPFSSLEFNIYAIGKCSEDKELRYALHFDRHNDEGNPSKETHPMYHFQFGGRKLKDENINIDIGQTIFFDTPRIMHHPMEFILGIDFLLSNFFPKEWNKLSKKDNNYSKIIKRYQKYFVLPYYKSIVNYFDNTVSKPAPWNAQEIYPQLVEEMDDPKQIGRKRDSPE